MPYKDPVKQKLAQKAHYQQNKSDYLTRNQKRREERRKWFRELTRNHFCCKCGETEQACLDYHHLDNKKDNVSTMLNTFRSKEDIIAELAKCICVCANCHRKIHAGILDT